MVDDDTTNTPPPSGEDPNADGTSAAEGWGAALDEQKSASEPEKATFEHLTAEKKIENNQGLDVILDIPVTLSMEVGKTTISIRNLLQLNQGSVVELDRLAGEPLDLMVNGTLIAHGEVVVVNEKFGVRLTSVMSAEDRIKKLSAEPSM